ncbi:MAG TPA: hypothetical protein VM451_10355 [Candidatus Limnocylindria bacterium]|nr:hypothetical protein [Candidatus Limnocylindria bacterium]
MADSERRAERRRLLWRDSATILIGVVIALLVGQMIFPQRVGTPVQTGGEIPSGIVIGSVGPSFSLPPGVTFGPIIDPSLRIDATGTPIPVITMGPTPTPSPSPSPSLKPSGSLKPTGSPRPSGSLKPTPKPSPKPSATAAPPTPTNPPTNPPPPTDPPPTDPPPTDPPPNPTP